MALCWNSNNAPYLPKDANRDQNKWVFAVGTQSGNGRWIYVCDSGGMRSSFTGAGGTHSWNNSADMMIGSTNSGSSIPPASTKVGPVLIYNRFFTSNEVLQNFNALKGRFGL
jgi:hypothetical protein